MELILGMIRRFETKNKTITLWIIFKSIFKNKLDVHILFLEEVVGKLDMKSDLMGYDWLV